MCTDKNFMQLVNENRLRLDATYAFIEYSKLYRNLDLTISSEPASNADIITTYPQWRVIAGINEELNAFQHAYASAIIAYHYNKELALALGDIKEIVTWDVEDNIQDRNRDLWNNMIGAQYAIEQKNKGEKFQSISENIFKDIYSNNSSYIINLNDAELRKATGSNNKKELILHCIESIKRALNKMNIYKNKNISCFLNNYTKLKEYSNTENWTKITTILNKKLENFLELFYNNTISQMENLPKYFDTEKVINKYSKNWGNKIKGTDMGLAADLFSEEEIEELKERMKHERLPQETLKKMGEYHRRKFNERIKSAMTYEGDGSDITIANFVDKEGNFTFIPQKVEPTKPHPPVRNSKNSTSKDLSKDEKWQSFRKLLRTFFAIPDDDGKPMGKINSADVYNAIDVMETMKKAMHESEVTEIPDSKGSIKDSMQFEFISDEAQADVMQSALSQTSEQIKSDIKTEILDEISRQTMFPDREHVENIMRDVFDSVAYRRGYKINEEQY